MTSHFILYTHKYCGFVWIRDMNSKMIYLGKLQLSRHSLVGDIPLGIEMPGEWGGNCTKYQMLSQTGLKWPKDMGFFRWHFTVVAVEDNWGKTFQMSQPVPVLLKPWGCA